MDANYMNSIPQSTEDMVIEELASSEAQLIERTAFLESLVDSYSALARASFARLAELTKERDSKSRQLSALREEYAAFRAGLAQTPQVGGHRVGPAFHQHQSQTTTEAEAWH